jgi:hypothetical protein
MLLTRQHPASLQAGSQVKPRAIAAPSATPIRSDAYYEVKCRYGSIGDMQAAESHIRLGGILLEYEILQRIYKNACGLPIGIFRAGRCPNRVRGIGGTLAAFSAHRVGVR